MAQLQQLLQLAHTPGPQMTTAAQQLEVLELQHGFGQALLALLAGEQLTAQAAAIYLKNFLQRRWQSLEDRESLRDALVPMALQADRLVRRQLCAAVEELALQDLERWPALLPQLVSCTQNAPLRASAAQATMELAHAALRHLRSDGRHVELTRQARYCAEILGTMHLEIWRYACDRLVSSEVPDPDISQLLLAATEVLHDFTRLVMPEHVQQNLESYMQGILAVLQRSAASSAAELLQELCALLAMWLSRYAETLEAIPEKRWPSRSVEAVWSLLIKLDDSCAHDALAISAIAVLSSASCQEWQVSPFGSDATVLAAVCERVVLPNLKLRAVDLELFHEDLQEYIARDVEGHDIQTRRWAAIDLVRCLRRRHDKATCELVVAYISKALHEAVSADPQTRAICKHACIHLVISMAGSTAGQRITSPGGLATEFFKEQLGPELLAVQEPPRGTSVEAVLFKAACLKFITVLRNILPAELVLGIVPRLPLLLQAEHPLLHSYAAICGNVLTTVQDRSVDQGPPAWRPRYSREQLGPVLIEMIPILLHLLEGRSIPQNTHLIRALSAWLSCLGPSLPEDLAAKSLKSLVHLACAGPSNADYTHLLFACIALSLKAMRRARSPDVEAAVLTMVEKLWVSQAEDLLPYCYQILALMLDLGVSESIQPLYAELLKQVLAPQLWQAPGKVPGLVRLLRAFFAKVSVFRALLQQVIPSIFERFQQALANKQSASAALGLLCAAFRFLPFELYCNHFQAALEACLSRLESIKMIELEKDLVVAMSIFVQVQQDGAAVLRMALNQRKEGLFEHFLMEVWLPGAARIQLLQRRKICIFGLIQVMQLPLPAPVFEASCQALLRLLRLRQAGHPILIFEEIFNNRPLFLCKKGDGISPGDEFQVAYNHLEQAELKEDVWDVLPEIQDVATAKVAVKAALTPLQEALSKVDGVTSALEGILR